MENAFNNIILIFPLNLLNFKSNYLFINFQMTNFEYYSDRFIDSHQFLQANKLGFVFGIIIDNNINILYIFIYNFFTILSIKKALQRNSLDKSLFTKKKEMKKVLSTKINRIIG